ncbi:hypothetical protein OSB04_014863 [Centaurea solstitialis]|uniref:Transmembrane protein n=1 Tax=Centaurea solstitialis TaxID=347529 RepID=A0AA38T5P2_9ASTR|nr:hypothetical protein OSB04_014863 [Centaurea solstitialis]
MGNKSTILQPQSSLGFLGIVLESVKTTTRNRKLLVPILLLACLSFSLLEFSQEHTQLPFIRDFVLKLAQHPNMRHDLRRKLDLITYRGALDDVLEAIIVKHSTIAFSSITKLLFLIATVSTSNEAYTAKLLGPFDMFLKIRTSWKRPLLTNFYMILITLGISSLYVTSYAITTFLVAKPWSFFFSKAITFSIPVCYFYVSSLWMVSAVVSVLEDGFGGFKAIRRAAELMNGKRLQASLMMVPFFIAKGVVFNMFYTLVNYNMIRRTRWRTLWICMSNGSECLLKLFMFVVYTVFYHEQKKRLKGHKVSSHC